MTTKTAYINLLNVISDLIGAKNKLQYTFVFKGFRNNDYPRVSINGDLQCGLTYLSHWMTIEEAIERMEENGYIDINDFEQ